MKSYKLLPLICAPVALEGCQVVGGIFKAGVWTGVVLVVVIIGLVIWLISRAFS